MFWRQTHKRQAGNQSYTQSRDNYFDKIFCVRFGIWDSRTSTMRGELAGTKEHWQTAQRAWIFIKCAWANRLISLVGWLIVKMLLWKRFVVGQRAIVNFGGRTDALKTVFLFKCCSRKLMQHCLSLESQSMISNYSQLKIPFIHFRFVHEWVCVSLHVLSFIGSVMLTHIDWNCAPLTLWLRLQFVSFIFIYLAAFSSTFILFACLFRPCFSFRLHLLLFSYILWFQQD